MVRLRETVAAAMAAGLICAAGDAGAATTLNVDWDAKCGPTNCFTQGRYTHTWSAADATEPVSIGQLLLDRSILGDLDPKTFRLSFMLNGEEIGTWGWWTMGTVEGDELGFRGEAFTWNPADGDLVLVLQLAPEVEAYLLDAEWKTPWNGGGHGGAQGGGSSGGGSSGGGSSGGSSGDAPNDGQAPQEVGGGGVGPAAVPEPGAWALMISGFGMAGAILRRRRTRPGIAA